MAVIAREKPLVKTFATAKAWWLSPIVVSLLVACASIGSTALVGDGEFRALWRTPKWITGETLLLFGCGAIALAFGALIALNVAPMARTLSAPWPNLTEQSINLLRRASTVLTGGALIGYFGFAALILRSGLNPVDLFTLKSRDDSGVLVRDAVGTAPGITTLTQLGIAAVVVSSVLLVNKYSRAELIKLTLIVALALPRAFLFSERLAMLELAVPIIVVYAGYLSTGNAVRRTVMRLIPLVGGGVVIAVFAFFEYFRSWNYYRHNTSESYLTFILERFSGYYTTSLNNGHLALTHLDWSQRVPYDTLEALWVAPGIRQAGLYELLGGHRPTITKPDDGAPYTLMLDQYANPEFNNQSGYVGGFIDYGMIGGILYFILMGMLAGYLYRTFRQGKPFGLLLYPVVFIGLLEMPRYLYWAQSRTIPAWIGLFVVAVLLARCEARQSRDVKLWSYSAHQSQ